MRSRGRDVRSARNEPTLPLGCSPLRYGFRFSVPCDRTSNLLDHLKRSAPMQQVSACNGCQKMLRPTRRPKCSCKLNHIKYTNHFHLYRFGISNLGSAPSSSAGCGQSSFWLHFPSFQPSTFTRGRTPFAIAFSKDHQQSQLKSQRHGLISSIAALERKS